jgi:flagellar protein FliS
MQRNNPWQSYRKVAVQTASPGQMVLMLYEGAIRFLEQSAAGFGCDDPLEFNQTVNNGVLRAQAIIDELNVILNMEAGGEISTNFRRLYDYLYRRLQAANVKKQKEPIEEVIMHLRVLRDSWAEMLQQTAARDEQSAKPEASLQTA